MGKLLITYATMTGNSEIAATELKKELLALLPSWECSVANIRDIDLKDLITYKKIIFGISTWEYDLNPDSEDFIALLEKEKPDLSPITFGLFGLGDNQYEVFCAAVPKIKSELEKFGARIYRDIPLIDGYPDKEKISGLVEWAKKFIAK